jgi:hypothetical protein
VLEVESLLEFPNQHLNDDHCGSTAARLTSCIFQLSVGSPPFESAGSSRQMPVANRVVPVQADQCQSRISRRQEMWSSFLSIPMFLTRELMSFI